MFIFYIPWICCNDYNFFSMHVINWIKCMGGWMPCCHRGYIYMSNKATKKMKKKRNDLVCGQYVICKWLTLLKP
jgi:hypothetical protein